MASKGGRRLTPIALRDDVAEGIADAHRLVREMHQANVHHAREQTLRARAAVAAIARASMAFRAQREPELQERTQAAANARRRGHLRAVGE